jgi:hypothetical protein
MFNNTAGTMKKDDNGSLPDSTAVIKKKGEKVSSQDVYTSNNYTLQEMSILVFACMLFTSIFMLYRRRMID